MNRKNRRYRFATVTGVTAIILGLTLTNFKRKKALSSIRDEHDKFSDYYQLLSHWLESKNSGKSTVDYFEEKRYKHIAIYGMGDLANRLMEDLENSDIIVEYGIDRDACNAPARINEVYSPEDELPLVDAVVVTPFYAFDSVKNNLKSKTDCPVISLEEVVWSI